MKVLSVFPPAELHSSGISGPTVNTNFVIPAPHFAPAQSEGIHSPRLGANTTPQPSMLRLIPCKALGVNPRSSPTTVRHVTLDCVRLIGIVSNPQHL